MLSGCDSISGVNRGAFVHTLPDLPKVKAQIETYPEIKEVRFETSEGGRPLTLTGIKKPDQVFYLFYTDNKDIHGTLMFIQDYKGEVSYSQYLISMNRRPPQKWIDATWPVMKKVEEDLISKFDLNEMRNSVRVSIRGVENPERNTPKQ